MSDPTPSPVFTISAWADGEVTHAEPTENDTEENHS